MLSAGCSCGAAASASLFLGFCVLSCGLVSVLGRDFFPSVDAGQIRLHMRAPTGTRIEETARLADEVEEAIREVVPRDRARDDPRQPRRAEQRHQPVVQQRGHDRHARRRDPDRRCNEGHEPTADVRRRSCAPSCRSAFPASSSSSSRPTSSRRSSTSACPRRSTCRFAGANHAAATSTLARRADEADPADSRRRRRARPPAARRARRSTCRWTARACSSSA